MSKTALIISIVLSCILLVFLCFALPVFVRYQMRLEANNVVQLNKIAIAQYEQKIQIEQQKKQIRIVEAEGIAASQKIINATLTDKYLQHEAIEAQKEMAKSPNHTEIYIPVGQNGIPIVKTID